jgi:hypothetical protein
MYQLAEDPRPLDKTRLFIESCTSMLPTAENMHLVRSATSLVRSVLNGADIKPLRELIRCAGEWCGEIDDVIAAAGQAVIDEMSELSRLNLHDVVRRVAQIERDVLATTGCRRDMEGNVRTAYAG